MTQTTVPEKTAATPEPVQATSSTAPAQPEIPDTATTAAATPAATATASNSVTTGGADADTTTALITTATTTTNAAIAAAAEAAVIPVQMEAAPKFHFQTRKIENMIGHHPATTVRRSMNPRTRPTVATVTVLGMVAEHFATDLILRAISAHKRLQVRSSAVTCDAVAVAVQNCEEYDFLDSLLPVSEARLARIAKTAGKKKTAPRKKTVRKKPSQKGKRKAPTNKKAAPRKNTKKARSK
jgi:hypothetical protein